MVTSDTGRQQFSDIRTQWDARTYLDDYYGHAHVPVDEAHMNRFFADALRSIGQTFDRGLEVGCGPTLHHAAKIVPWVRYLDMADYQESNLEQIRKWIRRDDDAFDWSVYLGASGGVIDAENRQLGSVAERETLMRERIRLMHLDLRHDHPLGAGVTYPLVGSFYCVEWIEPSFRGWRVNMHRLMSLVAKPGWLLLVGVHDTRSMKSNSIHYRCARIQQDDVVAAMVNSGFNPDTLRIEVTPGVHPEISGIQGTFMAVGKRAS